MSELSKVSRTTLDILNDSCAQEQLVKGGTRLNQHWVTLEEAEKAVDLVWAKWAKECERCKKGHAPTGKCPKQLDAKKPIREAKTP